MIFIDEFKNDVGNFVEIEYQNSTRKEAIDFYGLLCYNVKC